MELSGNRWIKVFENRNDPSKHGPYEAWLMEGDAGLRFGVGKTPQDAVKALVDIEDGDLTYEEIRTILKLIGGDGHTIWKPEKFTDAGIPASKMQRFVTKYHSSSGDPKSTITGPDGEIVDEVDGVYGLDVVRKIASDYHLDSSALGRGSACRDLTKQIIALLNSVQTKPEPKLVVKITRDEDHEPRDGDYRGVMYTCHHRYTLGVSTAGDRSFTKLEAYEKAVSGIPENAVKLPLFLMDHSGLTLATDDAGFRGCDPQGWDWGQVGVIWAVPQEGETKEQVISILEQEAGEYNQHLQGDVWVVYVLDEDGNVLDSVGGCYGRDYAKEEGERMLKHALENV